MKNGDFPQFFFECLPEGNHTTFSVGKTSFPTRHRLRAGLELRASGVHFVFDVDSSLFKDQPATDPESKLQIKIER